MRMELASAKRFWMLTARPSRATKSRTLWVAAATVLIAGVAMFALAHAQRQLALERAQLGEPLELVYAPPGKFLEIVSLGYRHALADLLWFRTIDYFGRHYRKDRLYPWLAEMCERVTDLDPAAEHVYRFGGVILPWEANDIDAGIALLEKGVRNLPDSWTLRYMLGFSYYFFRDDLKAASRELRAAIGLPNAPAFLAGILAVIDAAHRGPEAAIEFLQAALATTPVPEVRETIRQHIAELEFARAWGEIEAAISKYKELHGSSPTHLRELVHTGLLADEPVDPFGGQFLIDGDSGSVRSSTGRTPKKLGSSKMREAILQGARRNEVEP